MRGRYYIRLCGRSDRILIMIAADVSPQARFLKGVLRGNNGKDGFALKKEYLEYRSVHVQDHPVESFEQLILDVMENGLKDWRLVVVRLIGSSYAILDGAHRYTLYREFGGAEPLIDVVEVSLLDRTRLLFEYTIWRFSKRFFDVQGKFLRDW